MPEDINPKCFSGVDFTEVRFQTGDRRPVVMKEAINPKQIRSEFASTFMLCPPAGLAFSMTEEWFYQMPPLPFNPNPVLAGDAPGILNKIVTDLAKNDNAGEEELSGVTIWAAGLIRRAIADGTSPREIVQRATSQREKQNPVEPSAGTANGGTLRKLDL